LKKMMVGLALGYPKLVVSVVDEVDGDNVQGQHCPMNKFYKDLQTWFAVGVGVSDVPVSNYYAKKREPLKSILTRNGRWLTGPRWSWGSCQHCQVVRDAPFDELYLLWDATKKLQCQMPPQYVN
jgi:hypothetical protein